MLRRSTLALLFACSLFAIAAAAEPAGLLPKDAAGRTLNLDFETGTLADWTAAGDAFAQQPIEGDTVKARRGDMRSGHQGKFWIGSYERNLDAPVGTLTSAPFQVTHPWGAFLHNGGRHEETRVELVRKDNGEVFYKTSGDEREDMRRVVVDLRKLQGKEIFIRLIDQHSGGWGHLNFDDFRFYDEPPAQPTPQPKRLVADMYPHSGLTAEEAAAAMQVPDGFSVVVSAAEPDIQQPIAMAIDERGRLWVAEAYTYPERAPEGEGKDRILIFADNDGDGKFDTRKVFYEGLNLVSGLEVGFGGVWVGAAPYLLFIPDRNGDDVPDGEPKILLDGWGYQDTHETLNAFIWGPDGWLYGCHGVFTHSNVGKPGAANEERTPINAGIWRYHPTRHEFEVFCHGTSNPWGVDFNDYGQAFATACVIPHLYHMIQGGRYERQAGTHFNPHTYEDIKTIADHRHYLGANPHGGNGKSDEVGGGHAHAGAMIYLGDRWPQAYRNQIFMNNIHGQRLNVDILKQEGSGYVGSHGPDFLLTGDKASQILNLRYLPDGNAYMIDWYDMQACHDRNATKHDRSNGRIYKICYGEPADVQVNLDHKTDQELAKLMGHKNDWYVRHARKSLQDRATIRPIVPEALLILKGFAHTGNSEAQILRGYWALHVTGNLDEAGYIEMLTNAYPHVRAWGVQLALEKSGTPSQRLLRQFVSMADGDSSPVVRLYLASAAQRMPLEYRWELLAALTSHHLDRTDPNLPLMYWYAAEPLAEASPEKALALGLAAGPTIPQFSDWMIRRIGSGDGKDSLAPLVRGLGEASDPQMQLLFLRGINAALAGQRHVKPPAQWADIGDKLFASDNENVVREALALGVTFEDEAALQESRRLAGQASANYTQRFFAIESLIAAGDPQMPKLLQELLSEEGYRDQALRGLAQYENADTPNAILDRYDEFGAISKRKALATLCSRASFALALLSAIENKKFPKADLSSDLVRQLSNLQDPAVDQRLAAVWGSVRATPQEKEKQIVAYKALLQRRDLLPATNLDWGRTIFAKTCQRCHTLYGVGGTVGPDLTGANRLDMDYLVTNIVDPSAVIAKEYQPTIVLLESGRVVTGIVRAEDEKTLTLQTAEETLILPKSEIDQRRISDKSMMPDDQLRPFSEHDITSLLMYLQNRRQQPMLATNENAAELFNSKDLTGWYGDRELWSVENGEIVGRTASGIAENSFLVSDLSATNFRLKLDIRLEKNEGNSGIQFRSYVLENGSVKGYQADAGPGWWGKLYEEHGRGLLWDKSGEEHLKPGEWNQYEIVAQGHHIQTYLNGKLCVDLQDDQGGVQGVFALQLHSGGPTEVRFRNLQLEILEPSE